MYMTGFRCNVEGGVATTEYPQPVAPRRGAISGPTQPMYWANDNSNLDYTPTWETKPSYNSAFGWKNGAQTSAFGAGGGGGGGGGGGTGNSTVTSTRPSPTVSQAGGPQEEDDNDEESTWVASSTSSRRRGGGRHRSTSTAMSEEQPETKWYQHNAEQTGTAGGGGATTNCKRGSRSRKRSNKGSTKHKRRSHH
jgi:hypothetical protein